MQDRVPLEANGKKRLTVTEYLEWEKEAGKKHEFYQGEVFALPANKVIHNIIVVNILGALAVKIRQLPFRAFGSDQRLYIPSNTFFTYPDISLVRGQAATLNGDDSNLLNPCMLVEVYTAGTREYDSGEKFRLYKEIPSLKEYLLIDSESIQAQEWHIGPEGEWVSESFHEVTDVLPLKVTGLSLSLGSIYEGTHLVVS